MKGLLNQSGKLLLSYSFLKSKGIKEKTIWERVRMKYSTPIKIAGISYLSYEEIPETWKEKLSAKNYLIALATLTEYEACVNTHHAQISYLQSKGFAKFTQKYIDEYKLTREQALKASQFHAVFEYVIDANEQSGKLESLYLAFNKLYPGKYSSKFSFANVLKKIRKEGFEAVCIDKRIFVAPNNAKRISVDNQYWAASLVSLGSKLSNRKVHEKLLQLCAKSNVKAPSKSWVSKYRKNILKNIEVYKSRNGAMETFAKKLPFMSTNHALHANEMWMMDGKEIPMLVKYKYYDEENNIKWKTYHKPIVVLIQDAFSKKYVGYAFGRTENTLVIMEALKKAINNTGCLPIEVVTDNHAYHQTKEAENTKIEMSKFGTSWRVTSNPQEKSIIERHNQHLDDLFSDYYGYIGKGIRAKSMDARPSQELIDDYAKNFYTEEEVKAMCIKAIEDFNSNLLPKQGKSPNDLYNEDDKSHSITVDVYERAKILCAKTERKISRGQITIKRGQTIFEYQLPSEFYEQYNDTTVIVRYEDLRDGIYLYDAANDEIITDLQQKPKIFGAKANQTDKDKELLFKNKGRNSGIKSKAKKHLEQLRDQAHEINPDAYDLLNPLTTPKDIRKELEADAGLKRIVSEEGINVDAMPIRKHKSLLTIDALKPENKLESKSPFSEIGKYVPSLINLNDFEE